jgi:S1-C subfamily serine protease
VIYTLLGSCRRHGVNLFDHLQNLFTRLPGAMITQIQEFTPAARAGIKARNRLLMKAV